MSRTILRNATLLLALAGTACVMPPAERAALPVERSTADVSGMQNRLFDTSDATRVMRGIVSTLQDRGYRIAEVDRARGRVTATRGSATRLVVQQQPAGEGRIRVTADSYARWDAKDQQVDAAEYYEVNLFAPLGEALGLPALGVPAGASS
ncbi:hypothetical protein D9599_01070 [Roseomonas sp. KE2513]|uniref:hypothetical protein n=1 Tax=Roseomonas sp. KE2513 TaxID=2479202 RepID=UPI0018E045B5|nr:hypothetical protein [Roseomonas sp. KE2513]MBI0534165.1 hypothetical protein [Roseomonas sp. KE2513]